MQTLGKEGSDMSCGTGECGCGCDDFPLQIHMKGKEVEEEASEEEATPITFAAQ